MSDEVVNEFKKVLNNIDNNNSSGNNDSSQNNNESNNSSNSGVYAGGGKTICFGADNGCHQDDCTKIQKTLESCGNKVKFTCIDSNQEDHMKGSGADFNVFFCNGVAPATLWSFRDAVKAGSLPFTIFAFITGPPYHNPNEPNGTLASMDTIRKEPFEPEWDSGQFMDGAKAASMEKEKEGKGTLGEWVDKNSQYVSLCSGNTAEELGQNICGGACGGGSGSGTTTSSGGGAQIKDKTFEHCIRRICAATDSVFIVENNAAVLFPYTDWMAFTLRQKINQITAKDMDPDLFSIEYNTEGFYNKVTTVFGADEEENDTSKKTDENKAKTEDVEKTTNGDTTKTRKKMPTGGTQLSEQYDPLVKIYGELEKKVTTNFPDEETAQYVTNALLIQYIRDFNNSCRVRVLNNRKYIGGTFYAVQNPNTKDKELFYLNSYTMFKQKGQPLTADIEFKYGPESAEELLDYQSYGGGGGGQTQSNTGDSAAEDQIWKDAAKFDYCHCNSTEDPEQAWKMFGGKEDSASTDCYGMSAYLYYRFNNQAKIPCRVVGNSDHHVVMLYKNNSWQSTQQQYRDYKLAYNFKWRNPQDQTVLLEPKNPPSGSNANAQPSGDTANQASNK